MDAENMDFSKKENYQASGLIATKLRKKFNFLKNL
jgi:hypothetical protein